MDTSKIAAAVLAEQKIEKNINNFKEFYKSHLKNVKERNSALSELYNVYIQFQKIEPKTVFLPDPERQKLDTGAQTTLKKYFNSNILDLYNRRIPTPKPKKKISNMENNFWLNLLDGLSQTLETTNEQYKQEWIYKRNFLNFLTHCLFNYGLHPDILKREPKIYKRYNVAIVHYFKSPKIKQAEYRALINSEILDSEYLQPYEKQLPVKFHGKLIPFKSIYQIKITSTLLLDDEIELFALKNNFQWNYQNKDTSAFIDFCQDETEELHRNPYLINQELEKFRNHNVFFVNPTRIEELKKLKPENFDLIKLIQLCEELNNASSIRSSYSPTLLTRAIIDHIPPIFGYKNFSEVANNYTEWTRSAKKAMISLDNSLRNIADNNIHSQARKKEVLPTSSQMDFTPELDLLLGEIVRILK